MDNKPLALSGDGAADPATQRAQIAETRNEMSATIEELHGRLNPTVLKEQAIEQFNEASDIVKEELKIRLQEAKTAVMDEIDVVKSKVNDEIGQARAALREATIGKVENMMDRVRVASRSVKDVMADNPVPAALAGLGLAWLFVAGRRKRTSRIADQPDEFRALPRGEGYGDERSTGGKVHEVAQRTGKRVASVTHDAGSAVSRAAHEVKESATGVAQRAQETASDISHRAGEQARRVRRRSSELYRSNPIAIGAAMLATGTIIGLAVPRTEFEDEWIGETRDDLVSKAQNLAHEAIGKAGEAVKRVGTDDVDDQNQSQGETFIDENPSPDPYH